MVLSQRERQAMAMVCGALQDPHRASDTCCKVILGCLLSISSESLITSWPSFELSQMVSRFMDVLMAFVTTSFSEDDYQAFNCTGTRTCKGMLQATTFRREMHHIADQSLSPERQTGEQRVVIVVLVALRHLSAALATALATYPYRPFFQVEKRKRSVRRRESQIIWPQHCQQLLPHNPEDTITRLLGWALIEPGIRFYTLNVLQAIAGACGQVLISHLARSDRFVQVLGAYTTSTHKAWAEEHPGRPFTILSPAAFAAAMQQVTMGVDFFALFMHRATSVDIDAFTQTLVASRAGLPAINSLRSWLTDLEYTTRFRILSESAKQQLVDTVQVMEHMASIVAAKCANTSDQQLLQRLGSLGVDPRTTNSFKNIRTDHWVAAFHALLDLSRYEFCAARDCMRSFAREGRVFQVCSGCGYMPYCSISCQRHSWGHVEFPHRKVCKHIRAFANETRLPRRLSLVHLSTAMPVDPVVKESQARIGQRFHHHIQASLASNSDHISSGGDQMLSNVTMRVK